jgi:UDP-N-acetylmuramyl pentapeptide phosphotransferase/UDP-N-acetylglucosamine-1-phosphate transferase
VIAGLLFAELIGLVAAASWPGDADLPGAFALPAMEALTGTVHLAALILAVGFFLLGLVDDLAADRQSKGLAGHLKALMRGTVTTGTIKAVGGLALALAVAWWIEGSALETLLDALLIALAANLVNLLDLRPGRAVKSFLILWLPVVATLLAKNHFLAPALAAAGFAAVAWLPADLGERGMLGDSGANMLGAILGAAVAWAFDMPLKLAVLAVLALTTLSSERWSFTKVIERVGPLRWFDELGRVPGTRLWE